MRALDKDYALPARWIEERQAGSAVNCCPGQAVAAQPVAAAADYPAQAEALEAEDYQAKASAEAQAVEHPARMQRECSKEEPKTHTEQQAKL